MRSRALPGCGFGRCRAALLALVALGAVLVAPSAEARLVEVMKPWGRTWISVPEPAGNALPSRTPRSALFREAIEQAATKHGVDPDLVEAIVACESAFDVEAVSDAGAMGLMQLMPDTARELGVSDAFDVAQNIDGGTRHIASLLASFEGDRRLAVAAYNAGEGAVRRAGGVPAYPETVHYVRKVEHYLASLGGGVTVDASGDAASAKEPSPAAAAEIASAAEVAPRENARRGNSVVMGRDKDGRLVFVNKPSKGKP